MENKLYKLFTLTGGQDEIHPLVYVGDTYTVTQQPIELDERDHFELSRLTGFKTIEYVKGGEYITTYVSTHYPTTDCDYTQLYPVYTLTRLLGQPSVIVMHEQTRALFLSNYIQIPLEQMQVDYRCTPYTVISKDTPLCARCTSGRRVLNYLAPPFLPCLAFQTKNIGNTLHRLNYRIVESHSRDCLGATYCNTCCNLNLHVNYAESSKQLAGVVNEISKLCLLSKLTEFSVTFTAQGDRLNFISKGVGDHGSQLNIACTPNVEQYFSTEFSKIKELLNQLRGGLFPAATPSITFCKSFDDRFFIVYYDKDFGGQRVYSFDMVLTMLFSGNTTIEIPRAQTSWNVEQSPMDDMFLDYVDANPFMNQKVLF